MVSRQNGSALIQVMVAMSVMGVITAGIMTVMDNGQRELKSLQQKIEIIQTEQDVMRDLSDPGICACNFDPARNTGNGSPLTFNTTQPSAEINLSSLYASCLNNVPGIPFAIAGQPLPGTQSGIRVSTIKMKNFQPTGTGRYRAELEVAFDSQSLELSRKPASVNINVSADTSTPSAARITSCTTGRDIGGTVGAGGPFVCPAATLANDVGQPVSIPEGPAGAKYFGGNLTFADPPCSISYFHCDTTAGSSGTLTGTPPPPGTWAWRHSFDGCPTQDNAP